MSPQNNFLSFEFSNDFLHGKRQTGDIAEGSDAEVVGSADVRRLYEAEDERGAEEPADDADSDDEVPAASRAEFASRVAELRLTLGLAPLELAG